MKCLLFHSTVSFRGWEETRKWRAGGRNRALHHYSDRWMWVTCLEKPGHSNTQTLKLKSIRTMSELTEGQLRLFHLLLMFEDREFWKGDMPSFGKHFRMPQLGLLFVRLLKQFCMVWEFKVSLGCEFEALQLKCHKYTFLEVCKLPVQFKQFSLCGTWVTSSM